MVTLAATLAASSNSIVSLWHLQQLGHDMQCVMAVVPAGFEARVFFDSRFFCSYQFHQADDVLDWADGWRRIREEEGWTCIDRSWKVTRTMPGRPAYRRSGLRLVEPPRSGVA